MAKRSRAEAEGGGEDGSTVRDFFRKAKRKVMLPLARRLLVPTWAKKALLDHDQESTNTRGIPMEVKKVEPILLSGAEVLRDSFGVPHIYTSNEQDLFFLQGMVHVEDRLFQMEMTRRLYSGTLAQVFGPDALAVDKFSRTMGWVRLAEEQVKKMKSSAEMAPVMTMMKSYVEGVNKTMADLSKSGKLPFEYKVAGFKPIPWTVTDLMGIMHVISFKMSFGFQAPIIRHHLMLIALGKSPTQMSPDERKRGNYARQYLSEHAPKCPATVSQTKAAGGSHANANAKRGKKAKKDHASEEEDTWSESSENSFNVVEGYLSDFFSDGQGSNWWCVRGDSTKEDSVPDTVLANDPHLDTGIPTFFYECHLFMNPKGYKLGSKNYFEKTGTSSLHFAGMTVPGFPGMVLPGHNQHVAWGVTLAMCDVEDVYIEMFKGKIDKDLGFPRKYQIHKGGKEKTLSVQRYTHSIEVKGRKEKVKYVSADTINGPIISHLGNGIQHAIDEAKAVAFEECPDPNTHFEMSYQARHLSPDLYRNCICFYNILRATSVHKAKKYFSNLASPSLNISLADNSGNIAYQLAGEVPIRKSPPGSETFPLCGWSGQAGWRAMVKGDQLATVVNPPSNRIVSANHKITDEISQYPFYLGSLWQDGFRAQTIHDCLDKIMKGEKGVSVKDCLNIQGCNQSAAGLEFVSHFKGFHFKDGLVRDAVKEMRNWKGELSKDSVGGCIYKVTFSFYLHNLFENMFETMEGKDKEFFRENLLGHGFHYVLKAFSEFKSSIIGKALGFLEESSNKNYFGGKPPFDKRELLVKSAESAVAWLKKRFGREIKDWQWGKIHLLKLHNPFSKALEMPALNVEFPFGGDSTTPNQATYNLSVQNGDPDFSVVKSTGACAACRIVMVPKNWDKSKSVLTGGQSAKWLSQHYVNQVELFQNNEAKPMLWSRAKVESDCVYKCSFRKAK
jgi:penicillin amidase